MKKSSGVLSTTFITTAMVLLFKVFGFIKQTVIAGYFGATELTDIYFLASEFVAGIAQAIVNALRFPTIAIYAKVKCQRGRGTVSDLMSSIFTILFVISLVIVSGLWVFAPQVARILAPGYSPEQVLKLQFFIRITSFSFGFIAIAMICNAILDSEKKFIVPRLQPLILSVSMIAACIFLAKKISVYSLVLGQYSADIFYCVILMVGIRKFVKVRFMLPQEETQQIFKLGFPLFIGNGMIALNQIVDKSISSGLGAGAVSALSYSHCLTQFVTSVMIINIGNVLFAHFSNFIAENREDKIHEALKRALNLLIYILVPVSVITVFCAEDIVRIVYHRGAFTMESVELTATVVRGYAIAFACIGVRDILTKTMYAYQDTRSPMINGSLSIVINIILSIILSRYIGILGIALGTSISAIITMLLNMRSFKKISPLFSFRPLLVTIMKNIPAMIVLYGITMGVTFYFKNCLIRFGLAISIGFFVYYLILYLLKADEIIFAFNKMIAR